MKVDQKEGLNTVQSMVCGSSFKVVIGSQVAKVENQRGAIKNQ